jgi:hypothetical protein
MTRKHFEAIAKALANYNVESQASQAETVASIANALAREFKQDNPRFKKELFLKACGVDNV